MPAGALLAPLFTGLAADIGITGIAGTILGGLASGALVGGVESAIGGHDFFKGALQGGLEGGLTAGITGGLGAIGLGGNLGSLAGNVLGGVATNAIEGKNIGQGALQGLENFAISKALGGGKNPFSGGSAATSGGGVTGAAGSAAPTSVDISSPSSIAAGTGSSGAGSSLPGDFSGSASSGGSGEIVVTAPISSTGTGGGGLSLLGDFGQGAASGAASNLSGPISNVSLSKPITAGADMNKISDLDGSGLSGFSSGAADTTSLQPGAQAGANNVAGSGHTGILGTLMNNPMLALAGGGMVANILRGNKQPAEFDTLRGLANREIMQGQQLEGSLQSGLLPAGMQANLDQATQAAIAAIKSRHASMGTSGSSAEAQEMQNAQLMAATQGANIITELFRQGVSETNMGERIYAQLMQASMAEDQSMQQSIANLSSAMAMMGQPSRPAYG